MSLQEVWALDNQCLNILRALMKSLLELKENSFSGPAPVTRTYNGWVWKLLWPTFMPAMLIFL